MAVVTTPAVADTYNALLDRVREMCGDGDAVANQKFTDAAVFRALTDMMAEMWLERQIDDRPSFVTSTTLTYPTNSEYVDLTTATDGDALVASAVYRVEDITDQSRPRDIRYVTPQIFERSRSLEHYRVPFRTGTIVYTLVNNQIGLRPLDTTSRSLRIWYFPAHPNATAATPATDQHPFFPGFEELIVIGASRRLQERDDEIPIARVDRYNELWEKFTVLAHRHAGPITVTRRRRWY